MSTSDVIIVLEEWQKESNQSFNSVAIKKSLSKLLLRENARSIYGSIVSNCGSSCQESQISTKKADAAAHLAAKQAEIHREDKLSKLREKLKKLKNQRDLVVIEAEYIVYAKAEGNDVLEGAEVGNTLHAGESSIQTNKLSSKTPQIASTPTQTKTELNVKREESLVQAFKEFVLISELPTPEPFVFTGDSFKFTEWSTTFKALIETDCMNLAYKLFYFFKNT